MGLHGISGGSRRFRVVSAEVGAVAAGAVKLYDKAFYAIALVGQIAPDKSTNVDTGEVEGSPAASADKMRVRRPLAVESGCATRDGEPLNEPLCG
jgi:hypothetical protein